MFNRKRIEYITVEEMNAHLEYVYNYYKVVKGKKPDGVSLKRIAYVDDREIAFELTYKRGSQACTYITRKDGSSKRQYISGMDAYIILQRYYKAADFRNDYKVKNILNYSEEDGKFGAPAKALLYANPKFDGKRTKAVGYDVNSAYSNAMLNDMPDTSQPYRLYSTVGENEIGFWINSRNELVPKFKGFATFIFPKMKTPFTRFVENYYQKKKEAKSLSEREKVKEILNYCIGYYQKTNPFMRSAIIYYANEAIISQMDDETLYCNTDSIVSRNRKPELEIGDGLGEWKIEHEGEFAYIGNNYQWNLETPSYRGTSKEWFKPGWDLLKDARPVEGNKYKYENYKLKEI